MVLAVPVVVAAVATRGAWELRDDASATSTPAPPARDVVQPHLAWAERECDRALGEQFADLHAFFSDARQNTRAFAADALGWSSKWRVVADHVPFTQGDRHEQFIRERFEMHLFRPDQVEAAIKRVVAGYFREIASIENAMLVRIQTDMADFPALAPIAAIDPQAFEQRYREAVQHAISAARIDLASAASLEFVSLIVGEVLTQVAVELGVSAGILGVGTALSWQTLGIGAVVGIIVDALVSWVWNWYADPAGQLAARLNAKLADIERLIVEGSAQVTGLRSRLQALARERARLRETAILQIVGTH